MSQWPEHHVCRLEQPSGAPCDRVVLEPRAGDPEPTAAVEIYLGTESAQWRAERVFVWSIGRCAHPQRRYRIHRMSGLNGFRSRGWATGFTNYRFAIPELAGARGRAIYNDEDQIYLSDPAELFDTPLGGHGFLALSDRESSVMLLDCERMASIWSLPTAQRRTKRQLLAEACRRAGLRGELDPSWNARDGEYSAGTSKLLHFTTLHTQPWRPFPNRFVYEPHPLASLWEALETEADAAGFELYSAAQPSRGFAAWLESAAPDDAAHAAALLEALHRASGVAAPRVLGGRELRALLRRVRRGEPTVVADATLCGADLGQLPSEDAGWVLAELFASSRRYVAIALSAGRDTPAHVPHAIAARCEQLSRRTPGVSWLLEVSRGKSRTYSSGGPLLRGVAASEVRVWALRGAATADPNPAAALALAAGWPCEEKPLAAGGGVARDGEVGAAGAPRRPDVVIAPDDGCAAAARAIRDAARGTVRVVQLGTRGGASAEAFDLVFSPRAAGLWPHPRRVEIALPLSGVTPERLAAAAEHAKAEVAGAPGPWIAVWVGGAGSTGGPTDAALTAQLEQLRERLGASLFVVGSGPAGAARAGALRRALGDAVHPFRETGSGEGMRIPLGLLALVDAVVVAAADGAMLAAAAASPADLLIARPAHPALGWRVRAGLGEWVMRRAHGRPPNDRGTVRPQRGLERLCARLIASGFVVPPLSPAALPEQLIGAGRARWLDAVAAAGESLRPAVQPQSELQRAAAVLRERFPGG